ncbi:MAG: ribbon-helix-helix domain-containing protein, partial [Magnetococcus sp. YQC-3]
MPKIASPEKGELVSVRVSPQTKFALELLSRIQRRTVSAIVSLAIEHELKMEGSRLFDDGGEDDNWEGKDESGVRY